MKYIRMKDGIYEIDEITILTSLPPCYRVIKPIDKYYAISTEQVIKQANTIEELCDEFVFDMGRTRTIFCSLPMSLKRNTETAKKQRDVYNAIYGAIWTDKGLIYVAKMNEKGELELI